MIRYHVRLLLCILSSGLIVTLFAQAKKTPFSAKQLSLSIVKSYPHDETAYTQGLIFHDNLLYEGTGQRGSSTLRKVKLNNGVVLQMHQLEDQFFGEGVTILHDKIYQLTWESNIGFIYDLSSFQLIEQIYYPTEGWGLTTDQTNLILSDGSEFLYWYDPASFSEVSSLRVHDNGMPVKGLNELEYVNGQIFANVYPTDYIVRIDATSGEVTGWLDCSSLLTSAERRYAEVLNGIAYNDRTEHFYLTGKFWPVLHEVQITE
ncbi:MAG: glutaminyl-peptide cyclotransferase [Calditrichia bacterium]